MTNKIGPLLRTAMAKLQDASGSENRRLAAATHLGLGEDDGRLPIVVNLDVPTPKKGEKWPDYKARIEGALVEFRESVDATLGATTPGGGAGVTTPVGGGCWATSSHS